MHWYSTSYNVVNFCMMEYFGNSESYEFFPIILIWTVLISVNLCCSSNITDHTQPSTKIPVGEKETTLRPLPDLRDTFSDIRLGGKVFVDKTPFVAKLLDDQIRCALLIRPDGFGKTNFLQMLAAFFQGKKRLFNGTQIYQRGNTDEKNGEWVEYPVIYLKFGQIANFEGKKPAQTLFHECLGKGLQSIADSYGVGDCKRNLTRLVEKLHKKFSLPAVLLIDEYERPVTDMWYKSIAQPLTREEQIMFNGTKDTLKSLLSTIKSSDQEKSIKLALMVGAAKLDLGDDLAYDVETLGEEFSCVLGFTDLEVRNNFEPHVNEFSKTKEGMTSGKIFEKLLKMYGEYKFFGTDSTELMNPAYVLRCLRKKEFVNRDSIVLTDD